MPFFVFAVLFIPYFTVLISYFYDLHNLVAALTVEKELLRNLSKLKHLKRPPKLSET